MTHRISPLIALLLLAGALAALAPGSHSAECPSQSRGGAGYPPERSEERLRGRAAEPYWVEPMRKVHARFRGEPGSLAQFGDSITVTQAFWSPLKQAGRNASPAFGKALARVRAYLKPPCWSDWKGPEYGSESGQTIRWAHEHVGEWLRRLNPEVALILFGSNDLRALELPEYRSRLRDVVRNCLANGTVVILTTPPPRHGDETKAAAFAAAVCSVARETGVPLIDFHAEIVRRRPHDWDGALDRFQQYRDYEVPTLISRDGVHPSYPSRYQNDYSPEALRSCGYGLRSYLSLLRYDEVVRVLAPEGDVIRAGDVAGLFAAAERARPGQTILLADGEYRLTRRLEIRTDRVTLRGASGQRERVILDGGGTLGELLALTACSGVMIADLTVQNVRWNGIKINSETGVHRLRIRNCVLRNIWQRAVKGVMVPEADRERLRPTGCRIEHCLFTNDRPKRFEDDPADTAENFGGNYVGGIDVMFARDWVIRGNTFRGIQGRTREARGAIFLWHDTRGCVVERNVVIDCDSGICLGNSHRPAEIAVHCTGCVVRNNFVTRAPENGILADYTRDCKILHNTVHDPGSRQGRLIRLVHDNPGLVVANNLLSGPPIRNESPSRIELKNNLVREMTSAFVDPAAGNLRLTARAVDAIDRAVPLPEVSDDIDGRRRGPKPDIGAHELAPAARLNPIQRRAAARR